jgi:dienelactone hydrolase
MRGSWLVALVVTALLGLPAVAHAQLTSVSAGHTVSGNPLPCTTQADGVRVCQGTSGGGGAPDTRIKSFDGTPLAVDVILPPVPSSPPDGSYPLIVQSHGWGSAAGGPDDTQYVGPTADQWAREGYVVLQPTARGFGDSCGTAASRLADPAGCANGYIHLDDDRYEVRDVQSVISGMVDSALVDPYRIGATGESYGGGVTLALATLKNRVMYPDGSLHPWITPDGHVPISLDAAAPVVPWSDLVASLVPDGGTLDTTIASPTADLKPAGVEKQSYVTGLFGLGSTSGYYAPAGTDPEADLTGWYAALNAGEPYDTPTDQSILTTIARYHSAYYLLDGAYGAPAEQPAPLLIANGFTDDLFPVDEGVRYANLEHSLYPEAPVALYDMDFGHSRGQNKPADLAGLSARIHDFLNFYVKGFVAAPPMGATALTQTCPASAPSGGPYTADSWAGLHPGVVTDTSAPAQTVVSGAGSAAISAAVDPITGQGACATVSAADQGTGVATYRVPAATGSGYTLLGAPEITADLSVTGTYPMLAERLWDVDPTAGTETLVARGLYRVPGSGVHTFQLHPGAWRFTAGHIPKLELLSQDAPYARTSNGQFTVAVSNLNLTLPVDDVPGASATPAVVTRPPSSCTRAPSVRITTRRLARGHQLRLAGRASERACALVAVSVLRAQRIRLVRVAIWRTSGHTRCRYVLGSGHLSRPRSCRRPLTLHPRGTSRWSLHLRLRVPRGRYRISVTAADIRGVSSPAAAVTRIRVR